MIKDMGDHQNGLWQPLVGMGFQWFVLPNAHQLLWFVLYNHLCCIPLPLRYGLFNFTPWKRLDLVNNHAPFNVLGANYVSQVFVLQKSSLTFCELVALV